MRRLLPYRFAALAGILLFGVASGSTLPIVKSIAPPENILFIGNSFTYYNNSLHNHVRNLMREGGQEVGRVRAVTISGAYLKDHEPALASQLESSAWDVVILQGQSMEAIAKDDAPVFQRVVQAYSKSIREAGAKSVLFMTWARTGSPEQTAPLNASYTTVGNETGSLVVPAGLAFARFDGQSTGVDLRTNDRRHPTLAGSYLAACTFYAALFGESPVGNAYLAGLNEDIARNLQTIAWETVSDYYGQN